MKIRVNGNREYTFNNAEEMQAFYEEMISGNEPLKLEVFNDDNYLIKDFIRTNAEWNYYYLDSGIYPKIRLAETKGKIDFEKDDICIRSYMNYGVVKWKKQKFYCPDGEFFMITENGADKKIELYGDIQDLKKLFDKKKKIIETYDLPEHIKDIMIKYLGEY